MHGENRFSTCRHFSNGALCMQQESHLSVFGGESIDQILQYIIEMRRQRSIERQQHEMCQRALPHISSFSRSWRGKSPCLSASTSHSNPYIPAISIRIYFLTRAGITSSLIKLQPSVPSKIPDQPAIRVYRDSKPWMSRLFQVYPSLPSTLRHIKVPKSMKVSNSRLDEM